MEKSKPVKVPSILLLPAEILGLIFGKVDDSKRCRIIPLVCQEFRNIHKRYPPVPSEWNLCSPIRRSEMDWVCHVASSLVQLSIKANTELGAVSSLLSTITAPKLELLSIGGGWIGWPALENVRMFSQITRLELDHFHYPEEGEAACLAAFTSLRSLQELYFSVFYLDDFTAPLADALWAALASLPQLDAVVIEMDESGVGDWVPVFLKSVTLMTRLRYLSLYCCDNYPDDRDYHPTLGCLTQLTSLQLGNWMTLPSYQFVSNLNGLSRPDHLSKD